MPHTDDVITAPGLAGRLTTKEGAMLRIATREVTRYTFILNFS